MPEEIRIVVKEVREGTALADATADAKKLAEQQKTAAAAPPAPPHTRGQVQRAVDAQNAQFAQDPNLQAIGGDAAARAEKAAKRRASVLAAQASLQARRAAGDNTVNMTDKDEKAAERKAKADQLRQQRAAAAAQRKAEADARTAKADSFREQRLTIHKATQGAGTLRAAGGLENHAAALEKEAAIRREALKLQRELGISEKQALSDATIRLANDQKIAVAKAAQAAEAKAQAAATKAEEAAEKKVTQELEKQAALRESNLLRGGKLALNVGLQAAGAAGGGMRGIEALTGMGAGLPGLIALAAISGIGGALNYHFSEEKKDAAEGFKLQQERGHGNRDLHRIEKYGTAQEAAEAEQGTEDSIAEKKGKREELDYQARPEWWDPRRWSNKLLGTHFQTFKGQRAIKENESEIGQEEEKKKKEEVLAKKMWKEGPEGEEIEAKEKLLQGDLRGAQILRDKIEAQKEYKRVLNATHGDEATAHHAADLKVAERKREEAMAYGHLVNARSGNADIARAASLAHAHETGADLKSPMMMLHQEMKNFHSSVREQHHAIMNASGAKFSRG